jgi:hypothetical protein
MKYQQIVFSREFGPGEHEFRQFYVPVEECDGLMLPCGPMREETHMLTQLEIFLALVDYQGEGEGEPIPDGTPTLPGWEPAAVLPLPDDYVPESLEVREEGRQRAIQHLKDLGVWRDRQA